MIRLIGRRVVQAIPVLLGVVVVAFLLNRVIPGDPAVAIGGPQATPADLAKIRLELGLDEPLWKQFVQYVTGLAHGDLGIAWHTNHPVVQDLMTHLPATIELALLAAILSLVIAVPLGIIAAVWFGRPTDYIVRFVILVGASVPVFWLAIEVIQLTYVQLGIAPAPSGRIAVDLSAPTHVTGLFVIDSLLSGDPVALQSSFAHLFWPALCLAIGSIALLAQITRASMLDVLGQDYMRTARAKGLSPLVQVSKHGFKNAAGPIVNAFGMQLGYLLGGSVIIESIFSWPGIGDYLYTSIMANDYAPVQAVMILSGVVFVVINIVVDIVQILIDRRVRLD